jgi:hypothetical protein
VALDRLRAAVQEQRREALQRLRRTHRRSRYRLRILQIRPAAKAPIRSSFVLRGARLSPVPR